MKTINLTELYMSNEIKQLHNDLQTCVGSLEETMVDVHTKFAGLRDSIAQLEMELKEMDAMFERRATAQVQEPVRTHIPYMVQINVRGNLKQAKTGIGKYLASEKSRIMGGALK